MAKTTRKPPSVTAADIIGEAINIFGKKGEHWRTRTLEDGFGNYCLLGGLGKAAVKKKVTRSINYRPNNAEHKKAVKLVAGEVTRLFDYEYSNGLPSGQSNATITSFNDARADGFKDIKKVLCSALQKALPVTKRAVRKKP